MSHSWLQKKRKGELLELALRANVPGADTLLKDDLVVALEQTLEANEAIYGKQSVFGDYYARSASPIKRERLSPDVSAVGRPRRRQTLVKAQEASSSSETQTPDHSSTNNNTTTTTTNNTTNTNTNTITAGNTTTTRTPRSASRAVPRRVSEVDLPPSPSQLADVADQSFQVVKEKANELWDKSRIDEWKEYIRENVSSVSAIQTLILLIEATGLQYNTLSTFHAFDSPPSASLGLHSRDVHLPDASLLLRSEWWGPATLWSLTSWLLPLVFSYFFNLTLKTNTHHRSSSRQSTVDPLTFNIVKAILAYSAYHISTQVDVALTGEPNVHRAQNLGWGPFDVSSVTKVRNNVPGGYYGLQIGAVVGVLVSLYDAALKK